MKAKALSVAIAVMVLSGLFLGGQVVKAQPEPLPALAIENLFIALNQGDAGAASLLADWHRDGLQYEVLGEDKITSITAGLDMVSSEVEISERGVAWGRQTIMAVVYDGQIQSLHVTGFRLTPWQYW